MKEIFLFFLNVIVFFVITHLIKWLFLRFISSALKGVRFLTNGMPILTIIVWMISPASYFVLLLFAVSVGLYLGDKGKTLPKRKVY